MTAKTATKQALATVRENEDLRRSNIDLLAALQGMIDRFADDGPESTAACAAIARAEE